MVKFTANTLKLLSLFYLQLYYLGNKNTMTGWERHLGGEMLYILFLLLSREPHIFVFAGPVNFVACPFCGSHSRGKTDSKQTITATDREVF